MLTFTLQKDSRPRNPDTRVEVRGVDIADAIRRSDINPNEYALIVAYEHDGVRIEIAGQANCGCVYHAEDGLSCLHDLEHIGLGNVAGSPTDSVRAETIRTLENDLDFLEERERDREDDFEPTTEELDRYERHLNGD